MALPDRFRSILWAAVLVTIAVTPLLISTTMKDVYRLPKTLFFQAATLLIGAAIVLWDANHRKLGELASPHRIALILAALALMWTAIISMTAVNPVVATHAPLSIFCYAVFFAATLLFARRDPGLTLIAFLTPAVINAVILILQRFHVWTPVMWNAEASGRFKALALQGNPDPAGMYLIIPAIVAIAAAFAFRRWRWPLVAVSAVLLVGLLLTESVTVIVALAAVFMCFIVVVRSNKARIAMIAMLIAGVAVLALYSPTRKRAVRIAKWVSEGRYQEATSFRLPAWNVATTMFAERPLLGVGPGGYAAKYMTYKLAGDEKHPEWMQFGNYNFGEAHNDHLQLLAEAGLPGYLIFLAIALHVALMSWRVRKRSDDHAVFVRMFALPAVMGFVVGALAQFPMHLTASSSAAVFAAALCFAWGTDDVAD